MAVNDDTDERLHRQLDDIDQRVALQLRAIEAGVDPNHAGQIQVKALISSAFTKVRDLKQLVANGDIAGARSFQLATSR